MLHSCEAKVGPNEVAWMTFYRPSYATIVQGCDAKNQYVMKDFHNFVLQLFENKRKPSNVLELEPVYLT